MPRSLSTPTGRYFLTAPSWRLRLQDALLPHPIAMQRAMPRKPSVHTVALRAKSRAASHRARRRLPPSLFRTRFESRVMSSCTCHREPAHLVSHIGVPRNSLTVWPPRPMPLLLFPFIAHEHRATTSRTPTNVSPPSAQRDAQDPSPGCQLHRPEPAPTRWQRAPCPRGCVA